MYSSGLAELLYTKQFIFLHSVTLALKWLKKKSDVLNISDYLSPMFSSYLIILHYLSCFIEEKVLRLYKANNVQQGNF